MPAWFIACAELPGHCHSRLFGLTWYPRIGFDQSWFRSDLDEFKLPDCAGVFPGSCDAAIANWIGTSLLSSEAGKPSLYIG